VANAEVTVHEPKPFAENVDEALVEFLERRALAAGPIQDHDGDGAGGEEIPQHPRHGHAEVPAGPRLRVEEWRDGAMSGPPGEREGEESGPAIAWRFRPTRPELQARQEQGASRRKAGEAPRGDTRVRQVPEGGREQHAKAADQQIAALDPIREAKRQTRG